MTTFVQIVSIISNRDSSVKIDTNSNERCDRIYEDTMMKFTPNDGNDLPFPWMCLHFVYINPFGLYVCFCTVDL